MTAPPVGAGSVSLCGHRGRRARRLGSPWVPWLARIRTAIASPFAGVGGVIPGASPPDLGRHGRLTGWAQSAVLPCQRDKGRRPAGDGRQVRIRRNAGPAVLPSLGAQVPGPAGHRSYLMRGRLPGVGVRADQSTAVADGRQPARVSQSPVTAQGLLLKNAREWTELPSLRSEIGPRPISRKVDKCPASGSDRLVTRCGAGSSAAVCCCAWPTDRCRCSSRSPARSWPRMRWSRRGGQHRRRALRLGPTGQAAPRATAQNRCGEAVRRSATWRRCS